MKEKSRKFSNGSGGSSEPNPYIPRLPENIFRKPTDEVPDNKFGSKINVTDGIIIPKDLLLTVPLSEISKNLLTSFDSLQGTLSSVSSVESTTLSSVANNLFTLLSKLAKDIGSENLSALSDAIPGVFSSLKEIISSLEIGDSISDAVVDIKNKLLEVIQVSDEAQNSESNMTKKLNDVVLLMATSVHVFIASITVIAEAAAVKIGIISVPVKEVVVSLTLILQTTIIVVQNISSSIASTVSTWPERVTPLSSILNSFLVVVDRLLLPIASILPLISSSVSSSLSLVVSTIGVTLTSLTNELNASMDKIHASIILEIPNKLESVLLRLIDSHTGFATSLTLSTETITKCISAVSSSNSGVQSKLSRQLYPVFKGLLKLTGSDDEIITEFISSFSNILDALKLAANNLTFGVGVEVTASVIKSIEDIFATLKEILSLVNQAEMNDKEMDRISRECAKTVQIFNSIVVAISNTISSEVSSAGTIAFEAVIALKILHSTVLYVVEWVTAIGAGSFLTKAGKTHEPLSSLAVIVVVMLQDDLKAIEVISGSLNHAVSDIVSVIVTQKSEISEKVAPLITNLSGVNTNTTVKIEQIGGVGTVSVEGIVDTKEGNLSEILNGLTGSLSSISSTFSSSLNRLSSSVKQILSSDSKLLQTIGADLFSIITNLGKISGSASQILSSTFNSLNSFFGHLLETSSKITGLGEVSVSVMASIAQVSTALHSFIYAINDYSGTVHVLIDSAKSVAKNVQILISTFTATIVAAAEASKDILNSVSASIAALPYIVSTTILLVQQVVGAAIPIVWASDGSITFIQHELTLSISAILETITSITANVTTFVTDGNLEEIASNILTSVKNLNDYTSSSLSKISGVVANIKATLSLNSKDK